MQYAVFKYDPSNMYRAGQAIRVYTRKHAAEALATKMTDTDPDAYKFGGYVVRQYRPAPATKGDAE